MPIDPSILQQGIQPIKIEDPLTRYSNYLVMQKAMNEQEDYQRGVKERDTANTVYRNALRTDGSVDETGLLQGYASQGLGYKIPDLRKSLLDLKDKQAGIDKTDAETQKARAEVVAKKMDFFNNQMAGVQTLQDAVSLSERMYSDRDTASFLTGMGGSREKALAEIKAASATPASWSAYLTKQKAAANGIANSLKTRVTELNRGDKIDLVQTNEYGPANPQTIGSYTVGLSPNRPQGTKVDIHLPENKAVSAFSNKIGEFGATNLNEAKQQAVNAYHRADRASRILGLLDDPNTITGAGADWMLNADRVLASAGVSGLDGKVVTTQKLAKELAANVLDNFTALKGMGVTRLTQGELEQIKNASPGKINLSKQTIRELVREDYLAAQMAVRGYNDQYQAILKSPSAGSLAPSGFKPMADIPDYFPQPSADDIATLKARAKEKGIREYFDKTYGPGAADQVLKGVR